MRTKSIFCAITRCHHKRRGRRSDDGIGAWAGRQGHIEGRLAIEHDVRATQKVVRLLSGVVDAQGDRIDLCDPRQDVEQWLNEQSER